MVGFRKGKWTKTRIDMMKVVGWNELRAVPGKRKFLMPELRGACSSLQP